jgi:hypothetical protein
MPTRKELLDMQFIDARSRVIDVAAFLDRIDRHPGGEDHRLAAIRRALPILLCDRPGRAKAVLEALSDTTTAMPESAAFQGACGAPPASELSQ